MNGTLAPYHQTTLSDSVDVASARPILSGPFYDYYAQLATESADDFIFQSSQLGFLDTDISIANFNFSN